MTIPKLTQSASTSKRARAHALLDQLLDLVFDAHPLHEYSTHDPACWPPHSKSRRHARDRIRQAGGERIGQGRATQWRITRAAFDAFYAQRAAPALLAPGTSANDDDSIAEKALADWRSTFAR
jgi:hypothetical protein